MSSDESDDDIPDVTVCQKLCEEFASITETDTACAQFYLQDRKWDLNRSVSDFFEDRNNKGALRVNDKHEAQVVLVVDDSSDRLAAAATAVLAESALGRMQGTPPLPDVGASSSLMKFITWNIDGLDEKNLKLRTKAVAQIVLQEQADVVFLQEVITESAEILLKCLPEYECLFGGEYGYFTATLLRKSTIALSSHDIVDFPSTRMMRNALRANVKFKDKPLCLLNTHLESTADGAQERKHQLLLMFCKALEVKDTSTVLLGGDLNLRDSELTELGGLPSGIEDLWIACGSRSECSYTWDMTRNDNLTFNSRFKPRCRFDRVYVRHSSPRSLAPAYFELIGLERLRPHRCFPSDHWGIMCHFRVE